MRQSQGRLPGFTQPAMTALTGLPLEGETQVLTWTPAGRTAMVLFTLIASLTTAGVAATHGGWACLAYVPAALQVAGGHRWLYIVAGHFAAHRSFGGDNKLVGEIVSTVTLTLPHALYERLHAIFHHSARLGGPKDPDTKLIAAQGLLPGTPLNTLRLRVFLTIFSPKFHTMMLWDRMKTNLTAASPWRRLAAVGFHSGLLGLAAVTGLWEAYFFAWIVPLTVLYNTSAFLQFLCEHRWFRKRGPDESMRAHQAKLTFGRFPGDALPQDGGPNWVLWILRLVFLHIPTRLVVLVGDLSQHDWHHMRPRGDWANAVFARRDLKEALGDKWTRTDEDEIHGSIFAMIDEVLRGISELPALTDEELEELRRPPR